MAVLPVAFGSASTRTRPVVSAPPPQVTRVRSRTRFCTKMVVATAPEIQITKKNAVDQVKVRLLYLLLIGKRRQSLSC